MWHSWGECFNLKKKWYIGSMREVHTILSGIEGMLDINCSFYFSYTDSIELGTALIWIRFKTKDMVLCVACSEPVELLVKGCFIWVKFRWVWKQTGQILGGRDLLTLTGLQVVSGLENLCGWKWVDPICSFFFLFHTWSHGTTAGGTTLFKVSPCTEAVLCSFLYYIFFLYT